MFYPPVHKLIVQRRHYYWAQGFRYGRPRRINNVINVYCAEDGCAARGRVLLLDGYLAFCSTRRHSCLQRIEEQVDALHGVDEPVSFKFLFS